MRLLVTGAKGFVGSAVLDQLVKDRSASVIGTVRSVSASDRHAERLLAVGDIGAQTDWSAALKNVDTVIHLAARAHVLNDNASDPMAEFRRVNVEGALALARQALLSGVKRFVFVSSIGVNGGVTEGQPFSEHSMPEPHADYAKSKFEAEEALKALVKSTEMALVIIRPPLVYAANAPGNFKRLLKLVASGIPLPFAMIDNQRSMIALENLVDFIVTCCRHPAAANETFLISDTEDVSIGEMMRLLGKGMNKKVLLLPAPAGLLRLGARLLGRQGLYTQLCCSLQVDASKGRRLLGWKAPLTAATALEQVGRNYKQSLKQAAESTKY